MGLEPLPGGLHTVQGPVMRPLCRVCIAYAAGQSRHGTYITFAGRLNRTGRVRIAGTRPRPPLPLAFRQPTPRLTHEREPETAAIPLGQAMGCVTARN
ncbi:hypothetical protein F5144DRAFT_557140 [Chaetomium tenue]|uniref:Uncharacterized protein n=1 Tax=Chaetomium tenue TaxID=1854479 RepID=A0ACB7PQT7_9PEZI|nr:hypothetical protein F5144DRAFT_557140 [Chaetomium globosum]